MKGSVPDTDVIIVGGGPAGAALGLILARLAPALAARTVILEAAVHPRDKPCGGGLTGSTQDWLEWLELPLTCPATIVRTTEGRFDGWTRQTRLPRPLHVVLRADFDHLLLREAERRGVQVRQGARVTRVEDLPDGLRVHLADGQSLTTRAVVAADGVRSRIAAERIGRTGPGKGPRARLLRAWVDRPASAPSDRMIFDYQRLGDDLPGYGRLFPCEREGRPTWNVGLMYVRPQDPPGGLFALLERTLAPYGVSVTRPQVDYWPEKHFDPGFRFAAPRVLAIGDAAGIEPLFGEGISQGFGYAKLAADALIRAHRTGDYRFAGYRRRVLASGIGREMVLTTVMARALYERPDPRWLNRWTVNPLTFAAVARASQGGRRVGERWGRFPWDR